MGLVDSLPPEARIANQRSGLVFGLLYYKKGLDPERAKAFADYKVDKIAEQLDPTEYENILVAVDQAPIPQLISKAKLLKNISAEAALPLLDGLSGKEIRDLKKNSPPIRRPRTLDEERAS